MADVLTLRENVRNYVSNSPNQFLIGISTILSIIALGPLPNVAVVILLSTLIVTTAINKSKRYLIPQFLSVALGTSISHIVQAQSAAGWNFFELLLLFVLSLLTTILALLPLQDITWNADIDHLRISLFPLAWSTLWALFETFSGLGRQGSWSPVGSTLADFILPHLGFFGFDFVVASLALIIATSKLSFYEKFTQRSIEHTPYESDPLLSQKHDALPSLKKVSCGLTKLLLCFFIILSFFQPSIRQSDHDNTLSVACVRPDDGYYIKESQQLLAHADILLWPETAIEVANEEERHRLILDVTRILENNHEKFIGMTLKGHLGTKPTDELVWLSREGVQFEYMKRYVVPIAESFGVVRGRVDPPTSMVSLPAESHNHSESLPLTVSGGIFFDGAFPMRHSNLQLFPAQTWDGNVGMQIYELTRAHARESSSALLWCDSGEEAISAAVDDQGFVHAIQRGGGSLVSQLPFKRGNKEIISHNFASTLGRVSIGGLFYLGYLIAFLENFLRKHRREVRDTELIQ